MSEEKMMPCPACGSENILWENVDAVICIDCYTQGPTAPDNELAIKAWNALPRALRWKKEPPKAAGWYWHRISPYDTIIEYVTGERHVQVGEYAGPISEPKEK